MNKASKSDLGNKEIFSKNLSMFMKRDDKSQRQVAKVIGVSPSTVSDWICRRAYPRVDKIQLLAEYFGVQKSDLVEDGYIAKETVSGEEQEIIDLFHKVPKEKREFVLSLIRAAIDNL